MVPPRAPGKFNSWINSGLKLFSIVFLLIKNGAHISAVQLHHVVVEGLHCLICYIELFNEGREFMGLMIEVKKWANIFKSRNCLYTTSTEHNSL